MKIYGIIYKITNKINGKVYIGQTTKKGGFDERYGYNLRKNTHNNHLKASIDKYGIENFEIDKVFDVAYSKEELDKKEIFYIEKYKCTDSNFGYNISLGGNSISERERELRSRNMKNYHSNIQKMIKVYIDGKMVDWDMYSAKDLSRIYDIDVETVMEMIKSNGTLVHREKNIYFEKKFDDDYTKNQDSFYTKMSQEHIIRRRFKECDEYEIEEMIKDIYSKPQIFLIDKDKYEPELEYEGYNRSEFNDFYDIMYKPVSCF